MSAYEIEDKPNYKFVKMDICDFNAFLNNEAWMDSITSGEYKRYYNVICGERS